jgi:hypothetical protein
MASFTPLGRLALVADGDLICWNCRAALIPGFIDLLVAGFSTLASNENSRLPMIHPTAKRRG